MYRVLLTHQAQRDAKKLKAAGMEGKAKGFVALVSRDPFAYPPAFEPLVGSLSGMYARRINRQHRFVYEVDGQPITSGGVSFDGIVKVLSMWTQYESV